MKLVRAGAGLALFAALNLADRLAVHDRLGEVNVFGWARMTLDTALWLAVPVAVALLAGRFARKLNAALFAAIAFFAAIQWYMRLNFDVILTGNWIGIVLSSSLEEIATFLRSACDPVSIALAASVLAATAAAVIIVRGVPAVRASRRSVLAGLLLLAAFGAVRFADIPHALLGGGSVATLVTDTFRNRDSYRRLRDLAVRPVLPDGIRFTGRADAPPFVVFVIGESATRVRWSLYGYERETTPEMAKLGDELVRFDGLEGSAYNTADALKLLFTEATPDDLDAMDCSFSQILAAAGYRGVLVSNQVRWGEFGGVESFLFSGCVRQRYLKEEGEKCDAFDEALLPRFEEEVESAGEGPSIVFLHLMGSHSPCVMRYPAAFAKFIPEPIRNLHGAGNPLLVGNHYDNSILYTDSILGRIVARLRTLERPTAMIYLSDHGESVESDHWRKVSDPALWQLPFVCWFSPRFRAEYPDTVAAAEELRSVPLRSAELLPTLLTLCRVEVGEMVVGDGSW